MSCDPVGPSHPITPPPGPVDPGYGVELPPVVDNGLPGIPAIWPPQRPNYPVDPARPNNDLPTGPSVWPNPPSLTTPSQPIRLPPVLPSHPIYHPGTPENPITLPPGAVWPPLPPAVNGHLLAFCWIVGVGYRWVVIDADAALPVPTAPSP